jgi:hypothetical protein
MKRHRIGLTLSLLVAAVALIGNAYVVITRNSCPLVGFIYSGAPQISHLAAQPRHDSRFRPLDQGRPL